jgi:nitrogen fixation NifU-like protein
MHGDVWPADVDLGDLEALEGVKKFPVRIKCALLPWVTLLDAILAHRQGRAPQPVSTEGTAANGQPMDVTIQENDR